jgi:microcystin-dependent protein
MIQIWSGLIADIPKGWILSDGTDGSPDMSDRFVRGILNPTTEPGTEIGGENEVTLVSGEIASHNHTLVSYSHTHRVTGSSSAGGSGGYKRALKDKSDDFKTNNRDPPNSNFQPTGGSGSHENKPPFYEVAFIFKT